MRIGHRENLLWALLEAQFIGDGVGARLAPQATARKSSALWYYRYHAVPGNIGRLSVFGQRLRRW
jgi:hypothetical protein